MPNLADPIILGYPDTSRCGMFAEPPDEHGRAWVQFFSMDGLRIPVIPHITGPQWNTGMKAVGSSMLTGPDMRPIEVTITDSAYHDAVH